MIKPPTNARRNGTGGPARVAIYARYSSDNQREASIADQVEVCRRYAERQGWLVMSTFDDAALSGSSARLRPGFQRMVLAAEAGEFDVIVCEAVDRLGRNLSDVAGLHDRLVFCGVGIHTPGSGALTAMHIGIMGMMAQMQLADLGEKTKRGQLGRVRAGRIPCGLAFGYDVVPPPPGSKEAGERRINEVEAGTVLRAYGDFAAGMSPRRLARTLNEDGLLGPGGRPWSDTTLRGQTARGTGLLNNTIYIGELVWNRCSYVKNPMTGKREARLNPPEEWERQSLPELRIVSDELWQRVKARQAATSFVMGKNEAGQPLNRAHRRKFVLSGLLKCGDCGGGYTIMAKDRYGCAAHTKSGTCTNGATISRSAVEERVLGALRDRMLSPDLVAAFIHGYQAELTELHRQLGQQETAGRAELDDVNRRLASVVDAIERGGWTATLQARLAELEQRKARADATQGATRTAITAPVVLHPAAMAEMYRSKVADLVTALSDTDFVVEAGDAIRELIDHVVMIPDAEAPSRHRLELHGALAMVLALGDVPGVMQQPHGAATSARSDGVLGQVSVVAGTGFEPVTFRL